MLSEVVLLSEQAEINSKIAQKSKVIGFFINRFSINLVYLGYFSKVFAQKINISYHNLNVFRIF